MRKVLWCLLLFAVVGCQGATPADPTVSLGSTSVRSASPPTVPRTHPLLVGAQFQGTWSNYTDPVRKKLLDELVAMGIHTVRISVSWAMLEPDRPTPGDAGWSWSWGVPRVDSVIAMARQRGLTVHATFGRTPAWANGGAGEAAAPTRLSDWRRAVHFVTNRYRGKVSSWEIWNEPNLPKFLIDGTPAGYTRLLCAAYPIIHRLAPTTPVVFGGVSGNDWSFIKAAYQAGAKGCFDVLAVHPYQRWGVPPDAVAPDEEPWYFDNVRLVRQVQAEFHDLKPIWFTEFGWSTHANSASTPEYERGVSEQQQARYLVQTLQLTEQRYPYITRAYIYQARDETDFDLENNNFGLFTVTLHPKPVVAALRKLLMAG